MTKLERAIKGIELCCNHSAAEGLCKECPYDSFYPKCLSAKELEVLSILKGMQPLLQPRLITESDFKLNADAADYIPAWCEEREYDKLRRVWTYKGYWVCINVKMLRNSHADNSTFRYWTALPTDEQRKAVKWDD